MYLVVAAFVVARFGLSCANDTCSSYTNCPTVVLSGSSYIHFHGEWNLLDQQQGCGKAAYQHKKTGYYLYYDSTMNYWGIGNTICSSAFTPVRSLILDSYACGPELVGHAWMEYNATAAQYQVARAAFSVMCRKASAVPCAMVLVSIDTRIPDNQPQMKSAEGMYTYTNKYNCSGSRVYAQYRGSFFLFVGSYGAWSIGGVPCNQTVVVARVNDGAEWPEEVTAIWQMLVRCGQDINQCHSNPCVNGARCNDDLNMYTCACVAGFEGVNCERSKKLENLENSEKSDCSPNFRLLGFNDFGPCWICFLITVNVLFVAGISA